MKVALRPADRSHHGRPDRLGILAVLLLLVASGGCGHSPTALSEGSPPLEEPVVLPTETCGDFFIAQTFIDDAGPFAMLLDTGAPSTLLSARSAAIAGVRSRIERVDIGDLRLEGRIRCTVREVDHIGAALGVGIDGVLGYDIFSQVLLTYDYPRQEVRARTGTLTDDLPGIAPMSTGNRPFVGAMVGDRKVNVLLDTGSAHGLTLEDFDRLAFETPPRPIGARMRVGGLHLTRAGRLADDVQFGPMTLSRPVVKDAVGDSLLGQRILRDYVVTLDRRRGRVQIVNADGTAIEAQLESPGLFGAGWVLRPGDDRAVIERVFPGTSAARAGFFRDDVVLAFNGVPFGDLGCARQSGRNRGPADVVVLIERDGERREVEMTTDLLVP